MFLSPAESGTTHKSFAKKKAKFSPVVTSVSVKIRYELRYQPSACQNAAKITGVTAQCLSQAQA
jgi:hypothetical protein